MELFVLQAALQDSSAVLHWLLEKGANPNLKDRKYKLYSAIIVRTSMSEMLLEAAMLTFWYHV